MSIVLKDGTVLPDIPSDVLAEYPYAFIVTSSIDATTILHTLFVTKNEFVVKLATDTGMDYDNLASKGFASVNGVAFSYDANSWEDSSNSAMTNLDASEVQQPIGTVVDGMTITLNWSNYDIMVAEADGYNPTVTVYFKSCIFILPDGTELPALPEGCFEKYPYGVIMSTSEQYGGHTILLVSDSVFNLVPEALADLGQDMIFGGTGVMYAIASNDGEETWQLSSETGEKVGFPAAFSLHWSNHDILTATAMNDDGTPEIGPDLYRKSDVNYRIYGGWLNSMGNQARRLGNVSGALKPGEMETVFSGATLEPLTVTPTTEEQTFTPESPCIGFSSVTVEAAPDTGGGDSGGDSGDDTGNSSLTAAEDACFGANASDKGIVSEVSSFVAYNFTNKIRSWSFYPTEDLTVTGLRFYNANSGKKILYLADANGAIIYTSGEYTTKTSNGVWLDVSLSSPITLVAGQGYTVATSSTGNQTAANLSDLTFNSKINYSGTGVGNIGDTTIRFSTGNGFSAISLVDIIIGNPELSQSYQVSRSSLDAFANQVRRITGTITSMSISEMTAALSGVTSQV